MAGAIGCCLIGWALGWMVFYCGGVQGSSSQLITVRHQHPHPYWQWDSTIIAQLQFKSHILSMSKPLKYRVYSASSEATANMTTLFQHGQGGWESSRSCAYPQQLTLQLYLPVMTKSLTIVFHQYKIPTQVQLFVKAVKGQKYRKLGWIKPSSNQQTGYEQKQARTIYFEFPCSFLKIVMQKAYQNEYNIFNQVAIQSINLTGELLAPHVLAGYAVGELVGSQEEEDWERERETDGTQGSYVPARNLQTKGKMQSEEVTREEFRKVYEELEKRKAEAVENEDYQDAALLKQCLQRFKQMEARLNTLEQDKKVAAESEDYDRCAVLKSQIQILKQTIQVQINNFMSSNMPQSSSLLSHYQSTPQQDLRNITAIPIRYSQYNSAQKSIPALQLQPQPVISLPVPSHQNQVVPAVMNKVINKNRSMLGEGSASATDRELEEFPQEEEPELMKLDSIDPKKMKRLEHHFPVIREELWKAVMTKSWKVKEKAFKELMAMEIKGNQEMMACYELCALTIGDKHPNIIIHTLLLLNRIVRSQANIQSQSSPPSPPTFVTQQLLISLISLFTETNPKIRQLSLSTFQQLPQLSFIPLSQILKQLRGPKQHKTSRPNPKLLQSKLSVLTKLVERYSFSAQLYLDILDWAVECLEDSSQDVRAVATELIVNGLMVHVGEEVVKNRVKGVRNNVLGSFMAVLNNSLQVEKEEFNQLVKGERRGGVVQYEEYARRGADGEHEEEDMWASAEKKEQDRQEAETPQLKVEEKKEELYGVQLNKHKDIRVLELSPFEKVDYYEDHQASDQQYPEKSNQFNEQFCDYCNERLQGPDLQQAFSMHALKQCKALTNCQACGSRIYIRQLTDHLLRDCKQAKFQQCRKCRLAFSYDEIYEHQAQNICKVLPKNMQRCQLCSGNVHPNDKSWVAHVSQCSR